MRYIIVVVVVVAVVVVVFSNLFQFQFQCANSKDSLFIVIIECFSLVLVYSRHQFSVLLVVLVLILFKHLFILRMHMFILRKHPPVNVQKFCGLAGDFFRGEREDVDGMAEVDFPLVCQVLFYCFGIWISYAPSFVICQRKKEGKRKRGGGEGGNPFPDQSLSLLSYDTIHQDTKGLGTLDSPSKYLCLHLSLSSNNLKFTLFCVYMKSLLPSSSTSAMGFSYSRFWIHVSNGWLLYPTTLISSPLNTGR